MWTVMIIVLQLQWSRLNRCFTHDFQRYSISFTKYNYFLVFAEILRNFFNDTFSIYTTNILLVYFNGVNLNYICCSFLFIAYYAFSQLLQSFSCLGMSLNWHTWRSQIKWITCLWNLTIPSVFFSITSVIDMRCSSRQLALVTPSFVHSSW